MLIGLFVGAAITRLFSIKDKRLIQQLATDLAVAEEKIHHFHKMETELKEVNQLFIETKTKNAELLTRIHEQEKYHAEKLRLLQNAELQLKNQFEVLAGKIFDERSKQFTEHNKTSLDHIVTPLREQLSRLKRRIETVYDNENKDRISLREEIVSLKRNSNEPGSPKSDQSFEGR